MPDIDKVGEFSRDAEFDDWWHSPAVPIAFLSGSKMVISIVDLPEEDFVAGEFPEGFCRAITSFLALTDADRIAATPQVYENYKEMEPYLEDLPRIKESRIWNHAKPNGINVELDGSHVYVVVTYDCDWEDEHGMRLVFQDGRTLTRVGPDDGHLHAF